MRTFAWLTSRLWLFVLPICSMFSGAEAGVLGSFAKVRNLPGYIDLNRESPWFKGVIKHPRDKVGIELRTPSQIIADYFVGGRLSSERIEAFIGEVEVARRNAFFAYCMDKLPDDANSNHYCRGEIRDEKLLEKWAKKDTNVVLQRVVSELRRAQDLGRGLSLAMINAAASEPFLEAFFNAFNLYESIKGEDYQQGRLTGTNRVVFENMNNLMVTTSYTIPDDRAEASNLAVPPALRGRFPGQRFLSLSNLESLQREGYDISALDPIDSGMWRKPLKAIRSYDIARYDQDHLYPLRNNMSAEVATKLVEPAEVIDLVYEPEEYGQGLNPKLYGRIGKDKWKVKFLTDKVGTMNTSRLLDVVEMVINSSEVNVENAVNNLAAAIGYTVDPTYYKHRIRLFLKDDEEGGGNFEAAYESMVSEIQGQLGKNQYIRSALGNIKTDAATGRRYIEIRQVNLEKKSDKKSDINVGLFEREGLGRNLQREHRAFMMFLAWAADVDVKNENVRLKMIPDPAGRGDDSITLAYSNSDMGAALGFGLPNYLGTQFITDVKRKGDHLAALSFQYRKLFTAPMIESVSLSDARWFARRLAQISPEQMLTAFGAAGFPDIVARTYALKMMGRRNQLLEAVGLVGETILDDEGQPFFVERFEEFGGSIPGYERFFKDGILTDPDNEIFNPETESFPRYWGTYWNPRTKDRPQTVVWKHMGFRFLNESALMLVNFLDPGAYYTSFGPAFSGIDLMRGASLFQTCAGTCFFQGVGLGVGTFAPLRFIVDNPDKESPEPFLIVDMFRIGLIAGAGLRYIESTLGLGVIGNSGIRVGGQAFQIYEFMKVRAVASIEEYVDAAKPAFKSTPKLAFEKARVEFLESMEPGDSMIISSYLGMRGRVRYNPFFLSPQVGVKAGTALINRQTIHKTADNQMLVNWGKINYAQIQALAGLKAGIYIDMAVAENLNVRQKERTFMFDLNSPAEHTYLMNHLNAYRPKDVPEEFSLRKRESKLRQNRFNLGFFTLVNSDWVSRHMEVDLYDYLNRTTDREIAYEKVYLHSTMKGLNYRTRNYSYKASINDKFDPFIKVSLELNIPEAREQHFLDNLGRISPLVPDDFIVFDPLAVKEYLGDLSFHGTTIFSGNALAALFRMDSYRLCKAYVRANPFTIQEEEEFCREGSKFERHHRLRSFMKDYKEAKGHYEQLLALRFSSPDPLKDQKEKVYKHLHALVDIFDNYNKRHRIVKVLRSVLPPDSFYQTASLTSTLNGFPADDDEIEISPRQRGGFDPTIRHLANGPQDVYALFSDKLHFVIQQFFFDPFPKI